MDANLSPPTSAQEPGLPPAINPETPLPPVLGSLPMHLLTEPLRSQIDWVQGRHGLTPTAASLAVLTTVLCACGPAHRIQNPVDLRSLPPALSVVLCGQPIAYLQAAVELSLDPVREWMLRRIGPPDKTQLRRAQLRLGELHQQRLAKEQHLNNVGASAASSLAGSLKDKELADLQKKLQAEHEQIEREMQNIAFLLRPHLLADDVTLPRLLTPGELSTDGALLHLSSGGSMVSTWTSASNVVKTELARLMHLAWHGLPDAGDDERHVRPQLSNLLLVNPTDARALWRDRRMAVNGMLEHLFFIPAATGQVRYESAVSAPPETADLWLEGLQALLDTRVSGGMFSHLLDEPAADLFNAFTRELLAEEATFNPEEARRRQRVPTLALKLAVLIHAVSPEAKESSIGAGAAEFACALAAALGVEDLEFVRSLVPQASSGTTISEEAAVLALVNKLRLRGPLRWRELLRSQRVQKTDLLEKRLGLAIAAGWIRLEGNLYHVAKEL